jgi:hypothetical protein
MSTKGKWIIDGTQIVSIDGEDRIFSNETICDFNPDTEYPSVHERNSNESFENAKLICKAPQMHEAIKEVLDLFDGNGVPNMEWIKNRLQEAIL